MIPVLYAAGETAFTTNGFGALAETVSCIVTEERNGAYELELQYPETGIRYNDIAVDRIVLAKSNEISQTQPFRIYRISRPINGIVTIYAEHISYQLSAIPVSPFAAVNAAEAMQRLKTNAATNCPFTMWTNKSTIANFKVDLPSSLRSLLGGQAVSIIDVYGGEFEFDRYTVKLHAARGSDNGATLRYGKNITDIKQEENIQTLITGVYPYWYKEETYVELSGKIVTLSSGFSYARVIPLDCSDRFETAPTQSQLTQAAQSYLQQPGRGIPRVSLDVSFVQLWQTAGNATAAALERVSLCDTVTVIFEKLGISASAKVVRTVYDTLKERFAEISLGEARSTLEGAIAGNKAEISVEVKRLIENSKIDIEAAVQEVTSEILAGQNGYVTFNRAADGRIYEILIMDTEDTATATKVWRWNSGGLGYSSTGYNGPYETAMTAQGKIVADFITAGTLDASQANIINIDASSITTGKLAADRITTNGLKVGGWIISDNNGLYYGNASTPAHYLGTTGKSLSISGTNRSNIIFKAGTSFGVDNTGKAYLGSGTIGLFNIGADGGFTGPKFKMFPGNSGGTQPPTLIIGDLVYGLTISTDGSGTGSLSNGNILNISGTRININASQGVYVNGTLIG